MTSTPRIRTPRNEGTPRIGTPRNDAAPVVEEDAMRLVWLSLKDRIYQRSFDLRKTFRQLDPQGNGLIPFDTFVAEMNRAYQLSPVEQVCLRQLLLEADFNHDNFIDFREFCEMLKMHDPGQGQELSATEKKRFQLKGLMDKKMQEAVVNNSKSQVKLDNALPTNELGRMTIECPYGVLGDSERMDAVIATFLRTKYDALQTTFAKHDADRDGFVTWPEFRSAMKELDRYVFDDEIDNLLHELDKKKRGKINIEEFVSGAGREYLKKKAHRSNVQQSPFVWESQEKSPRTPREGPMTAEGKPLKKLKKPSGTKASDLRTQDNRLRLQDFSRKEDEDLFRRVVAGTSALVPRGSAREAGPTSTPRLPHILPRREMAGGQPVVAAQ